MLTSGLDILRILAEAEEPLTATAIAQRVGLHVSNVSRTLRVLSAHGYVCKPSYHSFAADLGVLALAGSAAARLPVIARTRQLMINAQLATGLQVTLAALHRDQVLYLHRCPMQGPLVSAMAGGFPLHRSVVGLRLLLDLPPGQALELLETAARRYGWERPSDDTPVDPAHCLKAAQARLQQGILRTDHWQPGGEVAAAIGVTVAGQPPLALSLDGPGPVSDEELRQLLLPLQQRLTTCLEQPS